MDSGNTDYAVDMNMKHGHRYAAWTEVSLICTCSRDMACTGSIGMNVDIQHELIQAACRLGLYESLGVWDLPAILRDSFNNSKPIFYGGEDIRSQYMLRDHVHAACPSTCCVFISMLHAPCLHVQYMLLVHIHAACPISMLPVHVNAACSSPTSSDMDLQHVLGNAAWTCTRSI